ncbi:putative Sprouty-related, EVH1 domain-containing protein 1 [Hypsibius exemplaris]|uniref:Sprouty-related, EVH1 domain-containing protein 1 n=1 Tax=Hypsibius exemplaris TaxID=2072580 RepID=A0A9X6NLJ2_HYPEX|nr:putative Sprouty-related, EVH1 domain-containing protein 1 [Hypsibius exemplaris]
MTEGILSSDECLVRVRANVMTRDDSTGGWAPVPGGGMSFVALRRLSTFVTPTSTSSPALSSSPTTAAAAAAPFTAAAAALEETVPLTLPVSAKKGTKVQYLITGHRISDESVCLDCVMRRDLQYNQVTPTFRHWQLQGKKFGLTFQSSGDAKAFDVAVERALTELKSYTPEPSPTFGKSIASEEESWDDKEISTGSERSDSMRIRIPGKPVRIFNPAKPPLTAANRRSASPQLSTISVPSPVRYQRAHAAEPAKRILSLPTNMTKSRSTPLQSPYREPAAGLPPVRLSSSHIMETSSKELSTPLVPISSTSADSGGSAAASSSSCHERYTYVDVISSGAPKITEDRASGSSVYGDPPSSGGPHDYHYPSLEGRSRKSEKRDSISSIKMHNLDMMSSHRPPLLPIKNKRPRSRKRNKYSRGERSRCRYCHQFYYLEGNEYGACEFAPDKVKECIDRVSCIPAASRLLDCCSPSRASDEAGNGGGGNNQHHQQHHPHPCDCDMGARSCAWRWLALAAITLILPCLCCYYPLRGCHRLGLSCGMCGGKHEAMT